MRSERCQREFTLSQRLTNEAEFELLEIAETAVEHLRRATGRTGCVVTGLDQRNLQPAGGRIEGRSDTDDTTAQPDWSGRLDLRWSKGPLRLTYQLNYLSDVLRAANATVENDPNPFVDQNITHNISGQYDLGSWQLRAGIVNLTDEEPSYPTLNYGDIIGRQWFAGVRVKF